MMRAAVRRNSLLNTRLPELSAAVHSSLPPARRSHQAVWFYQRWMITPINAFSLTSRGWRLQMEKERKKWNSWFAISSFFLGMILQSWSWRKKSGSDVLTGPWLWWRDPITPLPRLVTQSSHHCRAYRQGQSGAVWLSDGCCVIPPLSWSCRLIPLTGAPPEVERKNDERDTK